MNVWKLSIFASLVGISSYANAIVSGSADLTITGELHGSNQCTISIDGGAALDAGVTDAADLVSTGGIISSVKAFNTTVGCTFPTAIAVKYSSSLPPDTVTTNRLGFYATSTNKQAAYLFATIGSTAPTAGGVDQTYAGVGDQDLSAISSANTFTAATADDPISGVAGDVRNAYTVTDSSNNPIAATAFVLPFNLGVYSEDQSSGWTDDIAGATFSLSSTVTVELHTL